MDFDEILCSRLWSENYEFIMGVKI